MAGTSNSITTHNVLSGVLNADNVISGLVNTAFNPAYALVTQAGAQIALFINNNDYKMYAQLKDKSGNLIYTSNIIDLPLETMVVAGRYDSNTKKLILVLDNGNEIEVPLEALINGLVNEDDLEANYYDNNEIDTLLEGYWTKIEITQEDIDNWNAKQEYLNQGDGIEISAETTLKGNTSQESTTGQQLFNYQDVVNPGAGWSSDIKGWLTCTFNNTGTSINYQNYFTHNLDLQTSTNYLVVLEVKSVTGTGTINVVSSHNTSQISSGNSVTVLFSNLSNNTTYVYPFSTKSDFTSVDYGIRTFCQFNAGQQGTIVCRISVVANTSVTPSTFTYEPYTGGNPAPNPDYPMPVNVVTGDNDVKVEGKNIWDKKNATDFVNAVNDSSRANLETKDNRNCIFYKDNVGYGSYPTKNLSLGVKFKENTRYTISYDILKVNSTYSTLCIRYTDGTATTNSVVSSLNTWIHQTLTSDANKTIAYIAPYYTEGNTYIDIDTFMVYEGTETLPYEPYQSQTYPINLGSMELCKIGDYQDYLYKENGIWYKYGAIGKVVLDGSENWSAYTNTDSQGNTYGYYVSLNKQPLQETHLTTFALSNQFIQQRRDAVSIVDTQGIYLGSGITMFVKIAQSLISGGTLANFKNWLSSNNLIVYYALATPTITPITDTTLIEQLDNLSIGLSNKWIKNISQTNAEIPFELEYDNTNLTISANLTDYYTKTETNTLLNDKVGFTDYATAQKVGVVKPSDYFGLTINSNGALYPLIYSYSNYQNKDGNCFVGKGTLENVLAEKIGNIQTLLDNLNTGSGV